MLRINLQQLFGIAVALGKNSEFFHHTIEIAVIHKISGQCNRVLAVRPGDAKSHTRTNTDR